MSKKLRFALAFAIITAVGIIIAQSYWIVRTYDYNKINIERSATSALQLSILNATLQKLALPPNIKDVFFNNGSFSKTGLTFPPLPQLNAANFATQLKTGDTKLKAGFSMFTSSGVEVQFVDSNNLKNNVIQNQSSVTQININSEPFKNATKEFLKQIKIDIPFLLSIQPVSTIKDDKNIINIPLSSFTTANKITVSQSLVLSFQNLNYYLLRNMVVEFLLTVGMIIIAVICLYYLFRIIYKQKQVAEIKNDFISNITHELKTPVSILMATNEALIKFNGVDDKEKTTRYLAINKDELNKLHRMLDRIINSVKQESNEHLIEYNFININATITEVINRFSGLDQVQVHFSNDNKDTLFLTNKEAFETIVVNLIDNAIKYSDKICKQVWVNSLQSEKGVTIFIKDNGIGIEKKYLPLVFDKFYRVPHGNLHDVKGYGLGLSYVKQLIESLHGHIDVKSEFNNGSEFTFNIPTPCIK